MQEEFERNLRERGDVGAAVAVVVGGTPVVDLWGGWLDAGRTRPWGRDSIVNVWSLGKAVTAICLLQQVEAGRVGTLEAPGAVLAGKFGRTGGARTSCR